jgi:MoaA/NifB/PqqE/SkfB family radical SAM enzyme
VQSGHLAEFAGIVAASNQRGITEAKMTQSLRGRLRLAATRTQTRGFTNTARLLRAHDYFWRYGSARKAWNYALVKAGRGLRAGRALGMPYRYHIDPINVCNLQCPVCPTGIGVLGRPRGKIDVNAYRDLVDQIAPYAYVLELFEWGEPFLHPQIFDLIRYAQQARISVRLSSNLNHFDAGMAVELVESGLDRLIVAVDGATQETYERYRRGGHVERVFSNMELIVKEKRRQNGSRPFIMVRMLVHRHNAHEIDALKQKAGELGADTFATGEFYVDTSDNRQVEEWASRDPRFTSYDWAAGPPENKWHCADLWESMHISWDGGATPCCWVHDKKNDLDNVLQRPIAQVWNGAAYVSSRRVHARGKPRDGAVETICTRCRGRPAYLHD